MWVIYEQGDVWLIVGETWLNVSKDRLFVGETWLDVQKLHQ